MQDIAASANDSTLPLGRVFRNGDKSKIPDAPGAYQDSVIVHKARRNPVAFVFDRDGTIQSAYNPPPQEEEVCAELMERCKPYATVISSAQTAELGMSSDVYWRSVEFGYTRPPVQYRLPNGTRTEKLEEVPGIRTLINKDAFVGFGTGVWVMKDNRYILDHPYDEALGGPTWRTSMLETLFNPKTQTGQRFLPYKKHLAAIDREGEYAAGNVDVGQLAYRLQFDFFGPKEAEAREKLHLMLMASSLRRELPQYTIVDESNLALERRTTYLVPKRARKERALERLFGQVSTHAGLSLGDFRVVIAGDTLTDLHSGLYGLWGAKEVVFILAANSRLAAPLYRGDLEYASMPLFWSRAQPDLTPRYEKTNVDGVYRFRAHRYMPWRKIILADYAPWSRGLGCAESVLACVKELGY